MSHVVSILSGISFASGLNIYATVLALGLLGRYDVIQLPSSLAVVSSTPVLIGAAVMYVFEFVADKVTYFDSIWDVVHTVIRPAGAAVLAYSVVGDVKPEWQILAAIVGGSLALTAHTAKASTRAAANVSPEPFSNWILSLTEDGLAFFLVWFSAAYPVAAIVIVSLLVILAVVIVVKLSRLIRRFFWRRRPA
jgi:hypothetical protein